MHRLKTLALLGISAVLVNLAVVCGEPVPHQPAPTATTAPLPTLVPSSTPTVILAGPPVTRDKAPTLTFTPAPTSTATATATQAMPSELPRAGG